MPSVFDRGTIYDYVYKVEIVRDEKNAASFVEFRSSWKHWQELVEKDKVDNWKKET